MTPKGWDAARSFATDPMRARVRKDATQPTVRREAVPWVLRAAATLPKGARVSNPLLGEDPTGTVAVIDTAAQSDAPCDVIDAMHAADDFLLVWDETYSVHPEILEAHEVTVFKIAGCDLSFGATYDLPEAPWIVKATDDPKTPADPDERRTGSSQNEPGSAADAGGGIEISETTEIALKNKVTEHNEKYGDAAGKKVTLGMLKAVYRRGAGAFSSTHRPSQNRASWAMARVNAFLKLVRTGKPSNPKYVTDNDLLPKEHPRSTRKAEKADEIVKAPAKYDHIDFKPPQGVAAEAEKGLEYRKKGGGGGLTTSEAAEQGIGSGVARAASLKNRQNQSPDTVRRMKAFFDRHEKNKSIDPEFKAEPWRDKGYVAWLLWGGDAGRVWAQKIVRQMEAADEKAKTSKSLEPLLKPFAGFDDFADCVMAMQNAGHDAESARRICGALQAGDPDYAKGELVIAPGDAGYLAPDQGQRYRRVRTKDAVIIDGVGLLAKSAEVIQNQDGPEEHYILGVVLEPDEVDSQGDTISTEEIRRAAHGYMEEHGNVGLQHQVFVNDKIKILESYIAPVDFEIGEQRVKQGTWLMAFRVLDPSIWSAIKEARLTGLSIGGSGLRLPVA